MDQIAAENTNGTSFSTTLQLTRRSNSAYPMQHNSSFAEHQNNFTKKELLHMAFLYSDPLMMKKGGKDIPFSDPLDTEKEF